jgi:hypothetical protein
MPWLCAHLENELHHLSQELKQDDVARVSGKQRARVSQVVETCWRLHDVCVVVHRCLVVARESCATSLRGAWHPTTVKERQAAPPSDREHIANT